MSYLSKQDLITFRVRPEAPSQTHTVNNAVNFLNFPANITPQDAEKSFLFRNFPLPQNADRFYNSPNFLVLPGTSVRVLDYNLGKNQDYAEIELPSTFILNSPSYPEGTEGLDERGLGKVYIQQRYLTPIQGVKDLDRTFDNTSSALIREEFRKTLKDNQIKDLGLDNWINNFEPVKDATETEWIHKRSTYLFDVDGRYDPDKTGEVFFDKKTASYCVSVLTSKNVYTNLTDQEIEQAKFHGLTTILSFLKVSVDDSIDPAYIKNKLYYDLAKIIDINAESLISEQKIKFLVSVPHRLIAPYINKYVNAVANVITQINNYLAGDTTPTTGANIAAAANLNFDQLLQNIINQSETPEQRAALQKNLNISNIFIDDIRNKIFVDGFKNNNGEIVVPSIANLEQRYPLLRNAINTTLSGLFVNNFNLDIKLDSSDPFIFINYQKINLQQSRQQIAELKKILQALDNQTQAFFQEHEVTPAFDLVALAENVEKLFENFYEYSLSKISIKEGVSLTEAEDLIEGAAIYLNANADTSIFEEAFVQGIPEFFNVIGVEVFHDGNKITLGTSKKEDYTGVYGLTDKTLLFLLFAINEIKQKYPVQDLNSVDNAKYLEFINSCIYPPRKIIYKPNRADTLGLAGSGKCIINQVEYAKQDLLNQTAKSRRTLFNLIDSRNKYRAVYSNSLQKLFKDFDELGGKKGQTLASAIFTLFGNLDTTTIIATLIQCLRAKNVPIELIRKLIDILLLIYNSNLPLLCLLPPIKLPQIPALNIDLQIPVVDLAGGLYKGLIQAVQDLFNQAILELFKRMLDSLLDCEGAFGDLSDTDLGNVAESVLGQPPSDFGRSADALTDEPQTEDSEEVTIIRRKYSNTNVDRFIQTVLQDFNAAEQDRPKIINEMKVLIQKISTSVSTPEFLNLTIGRPSQDVETFIKDLVLADSNFPTIKKSNVFATREGVVNVFLKFSSIVDQETLQQIRSSTLQLVTDARALCEDRAVESPDEAMFLAKRFANEQIEIIKTKRIQKQAKTIELIERFLRPNGYDDLIPPIKCRINSDGTITPGLIPSEPHPTELYSIEKSVKAPFSILKKNFNKDIEIAQLACLTTRNVKKIRLPTNQDDVDLLTRLYPTYRKADGTIDISKIFENHSITYEPEISVNPLLKNTLEDPKKTFKQIGSEEILYSELQNPKPDFSFLDDPNTKLEFLKPNNIKIYSDLQKSKVELETASNLFKNNVKLTDGIQKEDLAKIGYKLEITNNKLISEPENNFQVSIEGEDSLSEDILKLNQNLQSFNFANNLEIKRKIFSKILFYNNVIYNERRRNLKDKPDNLDETYLANLYISIYNDIEKINEKRVKDTIIDSPLFKLHQKGRTNLSKVKLKAEQPQSCYKKLLSDGLKPIDADLHLLKLENEKNKIIEYYKNNKCFDTGKPIDGSETEVLNSYEQGLLNSYIDIFFRTSIYDYYIRAIYAFANLDIKETKNKLMVDFLYEILSRDIYFKKLKTITKNNKFIIESYKKQTKKQTATEKEAYKYFIEKNLDIVINSIDKKLIKAGFSQAKKESQLDKIIKTLDIAIVDDAKKEISFDKSELFNELYDVFHKNNLLAEKFFKEEIIPATINAYKSLLRTPSPVSIFDPNEDIKFNKYYDLYLYLKKINRFKDLPQFNRNTEGLANEYYDYLTSYATFSPGVVNWVGSYRPPNGTLTVNTSVATIFNDKDYFFSSYLTEDVNKSIKYNLKSFFLMIEKIKLQSISDDDDISNETIINDYIIDNSSIISILKEEFNSKIRNFISELEEGSKKTFINYSEEDYSSLTIVSYYPQPQEKDGKFNLTREQISKISKMRISDFDENLSNISNAFLTLITDKEKIFLQDNDEFLKDFNPLNDSEIKNKFNSYAKFFIYRNQDIDDLRNFNIYLSKFSRERVHDIFKEKYPNLIDVSFSMYNLIKESKTIGPNENLLLNIKRGNKFYTCAVTNIVEKTDRKKLDPKSFYTYKLVYPEDETKNRDVILTVFSIVTLDKDYLIDKTSETNTKIISIFNQIFRPTIEYTFYVIASICQTSLLNNIDKVFDNSKRLLLKNIRYSINSAYNYNSDEEDEEDENSFDLGIIIKAAIALPKVVIKGMAESADPNIAFSSKISLAVKIAKQAIAAIPQVPGGPKGKEIADKIPDIPVPVVSIPLGFTFPFLFTPLTAAYLALVGFGDEEDEETESKEKQASGNATNCETD
jgi:hypothetical protein